MHGYVTPTLIEATTKPHNPSIEYDLWLKWNQARIDANEAAMNAIGHAGHAADQRLVPERRPAARPTGCAPAGSARPCGRRGLGRLGPVLHADVRQHIGLDVVDGRDVQLDRQRRAAPGPTTPPRGRAARGRPVHRRVVDARCTRRSTAHDLLHDELENYIRGDDDAPRPPCCPAPVQGRNNWMLEYPTAYVIPLGDGQRSDAEANRLVEWLLFNDIEVDADRARLHATAADVREGLVRRLDDPGRTAASRTPRSGSASTSRAGSGSLYAPPAAWSHGYLWGADIGHDPATARASLPQHARDQASREAQRRRRAGPRPTAYVLELDSPTAVRTLNELVGGRLARTRARGVPGAPARRSPPGGVFAADARPRRRSTTLGKDSGLTFRRARDRRAARARRRSSARRGSPC